MIKYTIAPVIPSLVFNPKPINIYPTWLIEL